MFFSKPRLKQPDRKTARKDFRKQIAVAVDAGHANLVHLADMAVDLEMLAQQLRMDLACRLPA
jgi:hypothetical protein